MDADRVKKIITEEVESTKQLLTVTPDHIKGLQEQGRLPGYSLEVLAESPPDVRQDAESMMEAVVAAIDAWQRRVNRVVDGRVCLIALYLLSSQQRRIMERIMDEGVGPAGPHKN